MQDPDISTAFSAGHFHSPIVDPRQIDVARTWPPAPRVVGIDFNEASHREILTSAFRQFYPGYDYPDMLEETPELERFFTNNGQFGWLDSRALFVLLNWWRPRRLIEVGSGFSSLLIGDVSRRFGSGGMDVTCIDPYPRTFLKRGIPGVSRLIKDKVQNVGHDLFNSLEAGDVLFIDSSHVAKTDSDVNFLYFEVLPRLAPGVNIHIHDIFLPHDYPRKWVLEDNRGWNEQYVLRALLMGSTMFEVLFGCSYAFHRFPDLVTAALAHRDGGAYGGGSFWVRRR
jgi:hypothetical protein